MKCGLGGEDHFYKQAFRATVQAHSRYLDNRTWSPGDDVNCDSNDDDCGQVISSVDVARVLQPEHRSAWMDDIYEAASLSQMFGMGTDMSTILGESACSETLFRSFLWMYGGEEYCKCCAYFNIVRHG